MTPSSIDLITFLQYVMQDAEIQVPRYLSAQDRARLAKEQAEEEARAKAHAANDISARALKQMMNGSPTAAAGGEVQVAVVKPAWMEGDASQFTQEQQQEVSHLTSVHSQHFNC